MLARLLAIFPASLTGRTAPRAQAEVRKWTKDNATLRTLQYGATGRLVFWASDHPAGFALVVSILAGLLAGALALPGSYVMGHQVLPGLAVLHPDIKTEASGVLGTILSVQATLLALVYPITLAFMALMLQRAAHSSVALRVYLLDAAAVPVGASSVGCLLAAGLQYFLLPFQTIDITERGMTFFLVFNGSWLLFNVFLTGFLLTRTIRFIQDQEQRLAFTRIAVDTALRDELASSVRQHIYVSEPQKKWNFSDKLDDRYPQVQMFSFSDARSEIKIDLKADHVLEDVHLNLLRWVARRWARRAHAHPRGEKERSATLVFPARLGRVNAGEVVLCAVQRGPGLTRLERLAVRAAFWFRKTRRDRLSLSTRKMLEEIGADVLTAAEGKRINMALDRLKEMNRLHRTLLVASELKAPEPDGTRENVATINVSPLGWSGITFDQEWLRPYYEISRVAVNGIDEDLRLFTSLSGVAGGIAYEVSPQPESVVVNALRFGVDLAERLSLWWTRKADSSLAPGETFSGVLPAPMSKVYEQALLAFLGSWTDIHVDDEIKEDNVGEDPAIAWPRLAARAKIYARHIEFSAQLLLQAVSRRDLTGASRWLDHFIKWRGSHDIELEQRLDHDFATRNVTLTLASKDWQQAHAMLWDGIDPVTAKLAVGALNLAVHRYWESMRLYLLLLLTRTAGLAQASGKELEYAGALLHCAPLHAGSRVIADHVESIDHVLLFVLRHRFGPESVTGFLNSFGEKLRWDAEAPEVSGWIYSMDGTPAALSTMQSEQLMLMVALAAPRSRQVRECERLVESWWRSIDRLEEVIRVCGQMRKDVLSEAFVATEQNVAVLRRLSQRDPMAAPQLRAARVAVALALRRLQRVARRTRRITLGAHAVDPAKVEELRLGVGTAAFAEPKLPRFIERLTFAPCMPAQTLSLTIKEPKKLYQEWLGSGVDSHDLKRWGDQVVAHSCAWSVGRRIRDEAIAPVGDASWRNNSDPSNEEMQTLIALVAERCSHLVAAGAEPVILTGHSRSGPVLAAYRWGDQEWRCPLPPGITIRAGEQVGNANARTYINDVPVYDFGTPDGDCFVVPASMLKELQIEGSGAADALKISFEPLGADWLQFELRWRAALA